MKTKNVETYSHLMQWHWSSGKGYSNYDQSFKMKNYSEKDSEQEGRLTDVQHVE